MILPADGSINSLTLTISTSSLFFPHSFYQQEHGLLNSTFDRTIVRQRCNLAQTRAYDFVAKDNQSVVLLADRGCTVECFRLISLSRQVPDITALRWADLGLSILQGTTHLPESMGLLFP